MDYDSVSLVNLAVWDRNLLQLGVPIKPRALFIVALVVNLSSLIDFGPSTVAMA